MANVAAIEPQFRIGATNNYVVGDVGPGGGVVTLQLDDQMFNGTITVKGRARGATNFLAIPYTKLHLNGSAGDGTVVSTAITSTSLIQVVVGDGVDVSLEATVTGGSMLVTRHYSSTGA